MKMIRTVAFCKPLRIQKKRKDLNFVENQLSLRVDTYYIITLVSKLEMDDPNALANVYQLCQLIFLLHVSHLQDTVFGRP